MSPNRVMDIMHAEIDMTVKVRGIPGDDVTMSFWVDNSNVVHNTCKIGKDGTAQIRSLQCFGD